MFLKIFAFLFSLSSLFGQGYVTSHIHAQLGNQLFQIAVAVSYALDHGLDARFPEISPSTKYKEILHRVNAAPFPKNIVFTEYKENIGAYEEIKTDLSKNFYFNGYFQSYKYFDKHKQAIVDLFAPTPAIVKKIRKAYGHWLLEPTVALHLRTFIPDGNNPLDPNNWGNFHWEYFFKAMDCFPNSYLFLVFSDSIKWAKEHFPKTARRIVFIEGNSLVTDFYLMSLCDHQIVSPRSSFSWWAAYLNQNPNKIVVVRESGINTEYAPEEWIKF